MGEHTRNTGSDVEDRVRALAGAPQEHEETHHDALSREAQGGGGGERQVERVSSTGNDGAVDWHKELKVATTGLKELQSLDGKNDPESNARRATLVDQVDMAFQKTMKHMTGDATQADVDLIGNGRGYDEIHLAKQNLMAKLGLDPDQPLSKDQLDQLSFQNPQDTTWNTAVKMLKDLSAQEQQIATQAGQNLDLRILPERVALEQANFLDKYRQNGITADIDDYTKPISSLDIVYAVTNRPEFMAMGGREAVQRAGDKAADNINNVIPADQNPMLAMFQTAQSAQGMTPEQILASAKHATELADKVNPQDAQKKMDELRAQLSQSENANDPQKAATLQQQIKAWESLSHAQGATNAFYAQVLLQQQPPKYDEARQALLKASGDPIGSMMITDNKGQPVYTSMMMTALTQGKGPQMVDAITKTGELMEQAQKKAAEADKEKDDGKRKKMMDEAIKLGNEAIQQAGTLSNTFGKGVGKELETSAAALDKKIKDEEKALTKDGRQMTEEEKQRLQQEKFELEFLQQLRQLGQNQENMMLQVASWHMAKGDGHAAQDMLNDLDKNHHDFIDSRNKTDEHFKDKFEQLKDGAASLAEDNDIDGMSDWNPLKWGRKGLKWCEDHAKWIALGVALVAGAAVTIGTLGAGAPVGAAIIGGALVGFGAGAIAGTAASWQFGHGRDGLVESFTKVAPYAAAGGTIGAVGGYFFAPAIGVSSLGAVATEAGVVGTGTFTQGVALAAPWYAQMGAGALTAGSGALFAKGGDTYENWKVGKYDNWKEAAADYGAGVAGWAATGAVLAPAGVGLSSAFLGGGRVAATEVAKQGTFNYLRQAAGSKVGSVAIGGLTAYQAPKINEGMYMLANEGYAVASGHPQRWLLQARGASQTQIDAYREEQAAAEQQQQQPVQPVEQQPQQPQQPAQEVQRTAEPSTYDPNKGVSWDNYIDK